MQNIFNMPIDYMYNAEMHMRGMIQRQQEISGLEIDVNWSKKLTRKDFLARLVDQGLNNNVLGLVLDGKDYIGVRQYHVLWSEDPSERYLFLTVAQYRNLQKNVELYKQK